MPFPLSVEGVHTVEGLGAASAVERLVAALDKIDAPGIEIEAGSVVRFRGKWFGWSWDPLVGISNAILRVIPNGAGVDVRYHLSFASMMVIGTVIGATATIAMSVVRDPIMIVFFWALWFLTFGVNYLRMRSWVRSLVRDTLR